MQKLQQEMQKLQQEKAYSQLHDTLKRVVDGSWSDDIKSQCLDIYGNASIENATDMLKSVHVILSRAIDAWNVDIRYYSLLGGVTGICLIGGAHLLPPKYLSYTYATGAVALFLAAVGLLIASGTQF